MRPARTPRRFSITFASVLALAALACAKGPTDAPRLLDFEASLAKGGGTPATVSIVSLSPGLLPDAGGAYSITIPSGGVMEVRPTCSSGRSLDLQGIGAAFDALGTRSTCNGNAGAGFMFLKLFAHLSSGAGACPDQNAPNGSNFSQNSRYFFQTDGADADLKFDDAQYTLVLTDCTVEVVGSARHVTATTGNLYNQSGGLVLSNVTLSVDVTLSP